ncbi:MAG: C40 family peptidase, partial [Lachnospiraceae bacterium]|nr:C40 family peptidase [Lachnospiraceae bacterium]
EKKESKKEKSSSAGADVAAYALQFVGNPYVWGGTSLTKGADCSGFTLSVYAHFGISLPHSASAQSGYGTRVKISELKKGDLLFYPSLGHSIGHVAIYIGNGQIVHASSRRTGIKISKYNYKTAKCAVRLID